jgi:hypothetical protein
MFYCWTEHFCRFNYLFISYQLEKWKNSNCIERGIQSNCNQKMINVPQQAVLNESPFRGKLQRLLSLNRIPLCKWLSLCNNCFLCISDIIFLLQYKSLPPQYKSEFISRILKEPKRKPIMISIWSLFFSFLCSLILNFMRKTHSFLKFCSILLRAIS